MMPSRRSSTSLRVCQNHKVIHTIQDYPALASRARFFVSIDDLMPDGTNYLDLEDAHNNSIHQGESESEARRPRSHSADLVAGGAHNNREDFLHHIPACITTSNISAFLKALEHNSFATDYWGTTTTAAATKGIPFGSPGADRRFAFYALWLFFGCPPSLLRNELVDNMSIHQRAELIQYTAVVASRDPHGLINLSPLLDNDNDYYWKNATQLDIPLNQTLAQLDLKVALLLLQAHTQANPHDWLSPVKQAGFLWQNRQNARHSQSQTNKNKNNQKQKPSPQTPAMMQRLSPQAFAIVFLQSHVTDIASAASPLWTRENMELVFRYFLPDSPGNKPQLDGKPAEKPQGLEALLCRALRFGHSNNENDYENEAPLAIPQALRQWDLDEALLAPTLLETGQLTLAVQYPRPQRIVETVLQDWSPQQCAQALQDDTGGLGSLLDLLDNNDDSVDHGVWLSQIPVLVAARQELHQGMVQAVLYRLLFFHVPFDPTLPPELLGTALPIAANSGADTTTTPATTPAKRKTSVKLDPKKTKKHEDPNDLSRNYGVWALDHAVQYLEAGIDSEVFCKLPWNTYANGILLGRVVRALHAMETSQPQLDDDNKRSPLWNCVDLDKLSVADLEYVPPQLLAVYAVRGQRHDQSHVQELQATVAALQTQLSVATETMQRLEQASAKTHQAQASKIRTLEQRVSRLQTETKQLKRDQGRLQKRESAMKKMMETQTGQQVLG